MRKAPLIEPIRITRRQGAVLKLLRIGCTIRKPHPKLKSRLMDEENNPVSFVYEKTIKALRKKHLIIQLENGSYTAVKK